MILLILFSTIEPNRMHTNVKAGAHQGYDTFGEEGIRISTVPNGTDMNASLVVRAVGIARTEMLVAPIVRRKNWFVDEQLHRKGKHAFSRISCC
jgi:hypothetical protein